MGMFDSVVWDDGCTAQTKCWGRSLQVYTRGDVVRLEPFMWTDESAEVLWAHYPGGQPPTSYQLVVRDMGLNSGSFITVIDGRLFAWDGERRPELPLVDNRDCPSDGSHQPFATAVETSNTEFVDEDSETCEGFGRIVTMVQGS